MACNCSRELRDLAVGASSVFVASQHVSGFAAPNRLIGVGCMVECMEKRVLA
jgi:hypothetical protein